MNLKSIITIVLVAFILVGVIWLNVRKRKK